MQQGVTYSVDIVLCIDATGSMGPIIERVKDSALRFYEDLTRAMQAKDKTINALRVRVIAFRDYYVNGERAMQPSQFFSLPAEGEAFSSFVRGIRAEGGGDEPETSLEALALAMRSEWATGADKQRQVIVMWTDASAHPLEKNAGSKPANYPTDLPADINQLTDWWEGQMAYVNYSAKRLIVYAPDASPWTLIANSWSNTAHFPSKGGEGLSDQDYGQILDVIAASV